jgi:WD40 repeat protein/transcriptional regulator with XRE-family HTH domain
MKNVEPGILIKHFRTRPRAGQPGKTKITQNELAELLGMAPRTVREWESGTALPEPGSLLNLLRVFVGAGAFLPGHETEEASQLWEQVSRAYNSRGAYRSYPAFDRAWFAQTLQNAQPVSNISNVPSAHISWGEANLSAPFFGRDDELVTLGRWLRAEKSQLVVLLGMGGIGKTALSIELVRREAASYEIVIWRSLYNAPAPDELLPDLIRRCARQPDLPVPPKIEAQVRLLTELLQKTRCLLVLDNFEAVMAERNYLDGYEPYGWLLRRIGESTTQSCLLLTSRAKPPEFDRAEANNPAVRTLALGGLSEPAARQVLATRDLTPDEGLAGQLVQKYSGNPLALKLVAGTVSQLFGGDLRHFLTSGDLIFGDIRDLLDSQFEPMSQSEQTILYWLAISREPATLDELVADAQFGTPRRDLLEALDNLLRRRSWVERYAGNDAPSFGLQPVVLEYLTGRLVEQITTEISRNVPALLNSHALLKSAAKEYVRQSQIRQILRPVLERLSGRWGNPALEEKLYALVARLQKDAPLQPGFAAGNIINLLATLGSDLRGRDFSDLCIWQAYLRGVNLQNLKFQRVAFWRTTFSDAFASIAALAVHPDGHSLAAGTADGDLRVWATDDLRPLFVLHEHSSWLSALVYSPDGTLIVSGGWDGTIKIWHSRTGENLGTLEGHTGTVLDLSFSPVQADIFASAGADGTLRLWNAATGQSLLTQTTENPVWAVAFSSDGRTLAVAERDAVIRLWDVGFDGEIIELENLRFLHGHTEPVKALVFASNQRLLSAGYDKTVRLWNVESHQCLKVFGEHTARIKTLAVSRETGLLASGGDDQTARLWNIETGECLHVLNGHTGAVRALLFKPGGQVLVTGSDDRTIRFWNTSTGDNLTILKDYSDPLYSLAVSRDNRTLATGSAEGLVRLWNIESGTQAGTLAGHQGTVRSLSFSPDRLASGGDDWTVCLWNVSTGECTAILREHTDWVRSVAFSPNGQILASGSDDWTVRIWDAATGKCVRVLQNPDGYVLSVAFSLDGKLLAGGCANHHINIWEVATGRLVRTLEGHRHWVNGVAWQPSGEFLASAGSDGSVRIWEVATGQCRHVLTGDFQTTFGVAFDATGETLAAGGDDNRVWLWNVSSGKIVAILSGHSRNVSGLVTAGEVLLSAAEDGTVRQWSFTDFKAEKIFQPYKLYQNMNIAGAQGLTDNLRATLVALGAIEVISP